MRYRFQRGVCFLMLFATASGWCKDYHVEFSGNWTEPGNWVDRKKPPMLSQDHVKVRVVDGATATVTTHVYADTLYISDKQDGCHLVLAGPKAHLEVSGDLTIGRIDKELPLDVTGSLTVKDGARLTVGERLAVGYYGASTTLDIYNGTVVTKKFSQNRTSRLPNATGGQTTLHGGSLVVSGLQLDGGVLNIAGGTLRIMGGDHSDLLDRYISESKIMVNGSLNPIAEIDYVITVSDEYTVMEALTDDLG